MALVLHKRSARAAEFQAILRLQVRRAFVCLCGPDSNLACLRTSAILPKKGVASYATTKEQSQNRRQDAGAAKTYSTGATSSSRTSTKWPAMAAAAAMTG